MKDVAKGMVGQSGGVKAIRLDQGVRSDAFGRLWVVICIGILIAMWGSLASGTVITLSTHVSDGPIPPDVGLLNATLDFSVSGSVLSVVVTNLTDSNPVGKEFNIAEIHFNVPDTVGDLILTAPGAPWMGEYLPGQQMVNGFGNFDMSVTDGGQVVIEPGIANQVTFEFDIVGGGPYNADGSDFTSLFSDTSDGGLAMWAAAKFVQGPNDESGFGATIPEPLSLTLLGLGAVAVIRRRRA